MLEFKRTAGGFAVHVNGQLFGHISKERGFFTDSSVVKAFLEVSPDDLEQIVHKAKEVMTHGVNIPTCSACHGTPQFPAMIYNPNEGMQLCQNELHS
ncbi:MAG: hypothetical protein KGI50_01200 [Patescibacteria group bacterium]|nr:hypothetical protein [Patescibacteria group bacterium]MDE2438032.1 hypothetical protein [Patescibacteria group bacterium]